MDPEVTRILEELKTLFGKDDISSRERREALKLKAQALVLEKKNIKEIEKSSKAFKQNSKELKLSKEEIKEWDKAIDSSIKEHKKYEKSLRDVGGAVLGLGKAAWRGEGSISAFTENLRGFNVISDSVAGLGRSLDTNIETFRGLAQTGASFGQSIVDMRRAAGQALLPLDDFASLVANNAQNLAALFGSTTVGAQRIAELSEGFRTVGVDSLMPMGFTIDEINDTLLLNLERQRRTFNFDANAREQNIESALAYAKQLDRLAKLTGTQREELQRQIETQMSNERFQAMLAGQTRETGQRLETFAATIGSISPELAEGFQDLIANAGVPVTDAALQLVQNMPQARTAVQNLISGYSTAEQALVSVRDASIISQERFRKATVTGTVDFLRLQSGIIKLGSTALDVNAIMAEQAQLAPGMTQGLTTFQDATKRLSGQFQKIETGLLASFGPALGGLVTGLQGIMGGLGGIASILAKMPALTGTAIASIIVGRYLFDKMAQIAIVTTGVRLGTMHLAGAGAGPGMFGRFGKTAGKVGKFGLTRALPGIGAAIGVGSSVGMLANKDKKDDAAGIGGLGGAGLGALAGFMMGGPVGALIGAGIGSMVGQGAGALLGEQKQFGGDVFAGKPVIVGEKKPELFIPDRDGTIVADANKGFNFEPLETKMASLITLHTASNKSLLNLVEGLNTSVAIQDRTRKVTEDGVRATKNITGNVLMS